MNEEPKLYITHCVDTEGPLEEPVEATFERLRKAMGIELEPSLATLRQLQGKALDLNGMEDEVANYLAPKRLAYLTGWQEVEEMVSAITSQSYRMDNADPAGNPYAFTWFIIDIIGYIDNPRRKAVGYHVVWDKYMRFLKHCRFNDSVGWHIHTVPPTGHALHYNTCWTNNDYPEQVLARRIFERNWFPSAFRAGGHIQRNDLSYWLEQFIPFDFSSHALPGGIGGPASLQDWRHAPATWGGYHPDFRDYRKPGAMHRWLFRCLDLDTNFFQLSEAEVETAFRQVRNGQSTMLAYSSHDRRDMRPEIELARRLVQQVAADYPDVQWEYTNAHDAARHACDLNFGVPPKFNITNENGTYFIDADQPLFGPIPFLAVEEDGGLFYRDNPTIEGETRWAYRPMRPETTRQIGVAGANVAGFVGTEVMATV